jgi:signal transduction histidine kinase/PAS domain-containing protein
MAPEWATPVAMGRSPLSDTAADHLAALLAQAAEVPTVLVQLTDGTGLRVAGGVGIPPVWGRTSDVPFDATLGALVLSGDFPIVVSDIHHDARVPRDAPLRTAGGRAYLGFPIRSPDDVAVGVCAAVDYRPRVWTADEMRAVDHAAQACAALVAKHLARQEIDRQRALVDAILDSLHVGVIACDAAGRVTRVNPAIRELGGAPPTDGLVHSWVSTLEVRDAQGRPLPPEQTPLLRALRGEQVRDVDVVATGADGRRRTFACDGRPLAGPDGETAGAVVTFHEVTVVRRAERFHSCELAVAAALREAASPKEAGPAVLEAVARGLGWPYAELWLVDDAADVLRPVASWADPGTGTRLPAPDELHRGVGLAGAAWLDGVPRWIRDVTRTPAGLSPDLAQRYRLRGALAIPVRSGGDTLGVLGLFADAVEDPEDAVVAFLSGIAAHIGVFLERQRAEELERQLVRSKDDYLALVGHELRTPLTSISAGIELLRDLPDGVLAREWPHLLEVVDRNAVALRRVVDDLLDLTALDTGQATIRQLPVDLAELVREAVDDIEPTTGAAGLVVVADLPGELEVLGDRVRLRQVVDNLLDNAVKFTPPEGRIEVCLVRDGSVAELTVRDTGIGIPVEDREQVFVHLYRSPYARDRRIPGSGLGLVISRTITERHHGTIALTDREDPGTTVVVRIPVSVRVS